MSDIRHPLSSVNLPNVSAHLTCPLTGQRPSLMSARLPTLASNCHTRATGKSSLDSCFDWPEIWLCASSGIVKNHADRAPFSIRHAATLFVRGKGKSKGGRRRFIPLLRTLRRQADADSRKVKVTNDGIPLVGITGKIRKSEIIASEPLPISMFSEPSRYARERSAHKPRGR
jgi:hypothetical protein